MLNLPDKMSDLLELALQELEVVESKRIKGESVVVDMNEWCSEVASTCYVCLAGSILYNKLGYLEGSIVMDEDATVRQKMFAINSLRLGDIEDAYDQLTEDIVSLPKGCPRFFRVGKYGDADFKTNIRNLVKLLREYNL